MAYVTKRRNGRFEIRESLHTAKGPRARTLAGFTVLTDELLERAAQRAGRPFDADAVVVSGRRAGAPIHGERAGASIDPPQATSRFLAASRRMAASLQDSPSATRLDPGAALIELLGFADAVTAGQPARPRQRLAFPALARLARRRPSVAGAR